MYLFFFLSKIHAYNLETNAWEEIATKPHEKIGKFKILIHLSLINVFYSFTCSEREKVILLHYMRRKISVELVLEITCGTSLAIQWLRLQASTAGDTGSIRGLGTRIPHAVRRGQKEKKRNYLYSLAQLLFFLSN